MADAVNIPMGAVEAPSLDGYEIERRLGIGAGSIIYLVRKFQTGEQFALKHVTRQDDDKRMIDQVENEYKAATHVKHPYIRKVYHIERRKKMLQTREVLMLMEYCPGVSLEQSPARSLLDLLLIFRMVADALKGMHECGWVHCDIKPNNIIIAENGAIRIIDLGQSCPLGTVKKRIQGTPDYIAPEQVKRKPLRAQTDVFNLGATLYWALTGKHVPTLIPKGHRPADRVQLVGEVATGTPPTPAELKPKIPLGVSNMVMDCIRENPERRPDGMGALISRLDLLIRMISTKKNSDSGGVEAESKNNGSGTAVS